MKDKAKIMSIFIPILYSILIALSTARTFNDIKSEDMLKKFQGDKQKMSLISPKAITAIMNGFEEIKFIQSKEELKEWLQVQEELKLLKILIMKNQKEEAIHKINGIREILNSKFEIINKETIDNIKSQLDSLRAKL